MALDIIATMNAVVLRKAGNFVNDWSFTSERGVSSNELVGYVVH
jgi:hypothetical protein